MGSTWSRINDDAHQYGSINYAITGDMRQYGIVFVGTNGRGVVYGDINDTASAGVSKAKALPGGFRQLGRRLEAEGTQPILLSDLKGRLVRQAPASGNMAVMDLSTLPSGFYLARSGSRLLKVIAQ
jgi:hypothetical protein